MTVGRAVEVERAEAALQRLGFGQVRVRHYGETGAHRGRARRARPTVLAHRDGRRRGVHGAGYRYVTLDLEGFRMRQPER